MMADQLTGLHVDGLLIVGAEEGRAQHRGGRRVLLVAVVRRRRRLHLLHRLHERRIERAENAYHLSLSHESILDASDSKNPLFLLVIRAIFDFSRFFVRTFTQFITNSTMND